ncbi:MAG: SNF2-related protein, partial [Chloroflexi bacterium]|nr:SNF2-related protein [Chloroflexota bacterium]
MRLGEALRIGLGREISEAGLPVAGMEAEGWIRDFLDKLSSGAKISEVPPPATFKGELRPYQVKGLSWLAFLRQFGLGACLADDMGLGKTIEFIALMLHERADRGGEPRPGPTLLICPMSVVGNWEREIERFGPSLKVMVHHGADRLSGTAFVREVNKHDLVISTYALAHRDERLFSVVKWERVTLDEAQNIKNPAARQTQAIKKLNTNHRVALTGTPVENRLSDLWSIIDFLNPGYLKSASDFRTRFVIPIEKYRNPGRAETLKRLIQPFVLRRLKTDSTIINDLPEKMEMKVFCNLTQEQATLYQAVVKEMLDKIEHSEGIERKGLVLSTLSKLKQVCNHPAQFIQDGSKLPGRSGKLVRLEEMLEEVLAEGDKALIFTQFAGMGMMLRSHLGETFGCETLFLHGGTTKQQRDDMVQ